MRKKMVMGNWKMNLTQAQAVSLVESLIGSKGLKHGVDVAVCPPYLSIYRVRELLRHSSVLLGAQDVFWADKGAFTGRVSAAMLQDAGVQVCLVGHSEPRGRFGKLEIPESCVSYFGDTDESVNLKLRALIYHNIVPVLCVGETLAEREADKTDATIKEQLVRGLEGVEGAEFHNGVVAYEPVWAIGTGKTCESAEASRVCGFIRKQLAEIFDEATADGIRILYGGSVKASNSGELFQQPDIDGALVGGASLDPEEFCRIVLSA